MCIRDSLQADEFQEVRYKQMDEIYTELLAPYRTNGVPQIVCGDMNTESEIKEMCIRDRSSSQTCRNNQPVILRPLTLL